MTDSKPVRLHSSLQCERSGPCRKSACGSRMYCWYQRPSHLEMPWSLPRRHLPFISYTAYYPPAVHLFLRRDVTLTSQYGLDHHEAQPGTFRPIVRRGKEVEKINQAAGVDPLAGWLRLSTIHLHINCIIVQRRTESESFCIAKESLAPSRRYAVRWTGCRVTADWGRRSPRNPGRGES